MKMTVILKNILYLLACTFLLAAQPLNAQEEAGPIFSEDEFLLEELSDEQLHRLEGILQTYSMEDIIPIKINPLADVQVDGRIMVDIPGDDCEGRIFRKKGQKYASAEEFTWYGQIENYADLCECTYGGMMIMARAGEYLGQIQIEQNFYDLEDLGGGKRILLRRPEGLIETTCALTLEGDGSSGENNTGMQENENGQNAAIDRDGNCDVRVLVVFAVQAQANTANPANLANFDIDFTNQALRNSGVSSNQLNFVLAAVEPINIDETGLTMNQAVNAVLLNAPARRDFHDADIVVMIVDRSTMSAGNVGGITAALGPIDALAYSVAPRFSGAQTFAHEVGHIMGAAHEPCVADDAGANCCDTPGNGSGQCFDTPASFNHAHTWTEVRRRWLCPDIETPRRTIMYSAGGPDRIDQYSNPNIDLNGDATGIATERDNARTLRDNACIVAAFRPDPSFFYVRTQGENFVCQTGAEVIHAVPYNAPGPYTYTWYVGTSTTPAGTGPNFTVFGTQYNVGDVIDLQVDVTAAGGTLSASWFHQLTVVLQGYNGFACALSEEVTEDALEQSFEIMPNPFRENTQIAFTTETAQQVRLRLFDSTGKLIRVLEDGQLDAGRHNYQIDRSVVPAAGIYFLQFDSDEQSFSRRLVLQQ